MSWGVWFWTALTNYLTNFRIPKRRSRLPRRKPRRLLSKRSTFLKLSQTNEKKNFNNPFAKFKNLKDTKNVEKWRNPRVGIEEIVLSSCNLLPLILVVLCRAAKTTLVVEIATKKPNYQDEVNAYDFWSSSSPFLSLMCLARKLKKCSTNITSSSPSLPLRFICL